MSKIVLHSLDEIPSFTGEAEEVAFWETHTLSEDLLETLPPPSSHMQEELLRHRNTVGRHVQAQRRAAGS
jgi:hypothetical protein